MRLLDKTCLPNAAQQCILFLIAMQQLLGSQSCSKASSRRDICGADGRLYKPARDVWSLILATIKPALSTSRRF
jgi:hypothetical protein